MAKPVLNHSRFVALGDPDLYDLRQAQWHDRHRDGYTATSCELEKAREIGMIDPDVVIAPPEAERPALLRGGVENRMEPMPRHDASRSRASGRFP